MDTGKGLEDYITDIDGFLERTKHADKVRANIYEELLKPVPSVRLKTFKMFDRLIGGFRPNEFSILCGSTGCLGGETRIRINRGGKGSEITIRDLYLRTKGIANYNNYKASVPTMVRSYTGESIRLHKIRDVFLSGEKETWELRLSNNKKIRLTKCHKVLTKRGWVKAGDLKRGDEIANDNIGFKRSDKKSVKRHYRYLTGLKFHKYKNNIQDRVLLHRAKVEAKLNNLELSEFKRICKKDKIRAKKLKFIDPKKFHIHHKDHNHLNNDIENLEVLTQKQHCKIHSLYKNFKTGIVNWSKFISLSKPCIEPVYDIECEDPHHNFVANGLVVHNSGKTQFLSNLTLDLVKSDVPVFVASVETGYIDFVKRMISAEIGEDWNQGQLVSLDKVEAFAESKEPKIFSKNLMLSLYDNRIPIEELLNDLSLSILKSNTKVAIIDNLNFFLEVTTSQNSIIETDRVLHELIIFCKRADIHIIMVMHPKKTERSRVLSEFDIKGSSTAVQEAHNVFLFNRASDELIKERLDVTPFARELKIAKMRRLGTNVGKSLVLDCKAGVRYEEMMILGGV